jgi:hypothetical protein
MLGVPASIRVIHHHRTAGTTQRRGTNVVIARSASAARRLARKASACGESPLHQRRFRSSLSRLRLRRLWLRRLWPSELRNGHGIRPARRHQRQQLRKKSGRRL